MEWSHRAGAASTYKSTGKDIIKLGDYRLKVRITFLVQKIITRFWVSWIYEKRSSMSGKKTTRYGEAFLRGSASYFHVTTQLTVVSTRVCDGRS